MCYLHQSGLACNHTASHIDTIVQVYGPFHIKAHNHLRGGVCKDAKTQAIDFRSVAGDFDLETVEREGWKVLITIHWNNIKQEGWERPFKKSFVRSGVVGVEKCGLIVAKHLKGELHLLEGWFKLIVGLGCHQVDNTDFPPFVCDREESREDFNATNLGNMFGDLDSTIHQRGKDFRTRQKESHKPCVNDQLRRQAR